MLGLQLLGLLRSLYPIPAWSLGPGSVAHESILIPQMWKRCKRPKKLSPWVFMGASLHSPDWLKVFGHWLIKPPAPLHSCVPTLQSQDCFFWQSVPSLWWGPEVMFINNKTPISPCLWNIFKEDHIYIWEIYIFGHKYIFGHLDDQSYISYKSLYCSRTTFSLQ